VRERTKVTFRGYYIVPVLLALFISVNPLLAQQPYVHVEIKDGKAVSGPGAPKSPVGIPLSKKNNVALSLQQQKTSAATDAITVTTTTNGSTCGYYNGSVFAQASGGTPPYTYFLSSYYSQNTGSFYGVSGGDYSLTVTDALAQTTTVPVTVSNTNNPVKLEISSYTPASDCTSADASVTLSATGGTPPYEYSYDHVNYQAGNIFNNLYPGMYIFTVRDANGCMAEYHNFTQNYFISNACRTAIGIGYSQFTCTNTGIIDLQGLGDNKPYTYSLDGINYQSSGSWSNLAPGFYKAHFKDAAGNVLLLMIPIYKSCSIIVDFITVDAACQQNDGALTVNASLGTAPYSYTIDGINYQPGNVFTGLAAGVYSVGVRDANGVMNYGVGTVNDKCPQVSATATDETCIKNDGTVSATATKGTAPFTYSLDGVNYQTGNTFTGLATGSYTVYLKDALGFTTSAAATINNACVSVTASSTGEACNSKNGTILVTATNGVAPYQYAIDGTNFQLSNTFLGLAAGPYTITVKDVMGKTGSANVTVAVTQGAQVSAVTSPSACNKKEGSITITGTGGVQPYQYSLDAVQFQSTNIYTSLPSGNYTVTIKDANGCTDSRPAVIALTNDLTLAMGADVTICEGDTIPLPAVTNGLQYTWSPATGLNDATLLHPLASPATNTTYNLTAVLGYCTLIGSVTVRVNPAPIANAGENITICFGNDTLLSGGGGIEYQWFPATYLDDPRAATPVVKKPQGPVTYSLVVKDGNGCRSLNDESVTVTVTAPAKVFAGNDTSIVIGQPFQLLAQDINNSGFVNYTWTPSYGLNNTDIEDPVTVLDRNTKYTVTARTAAGCEGWDEINIKVFKGPDIYMPTAFTPNHDRKNDLFKPILIGIKKFSYFAVFNRWGQRIFYSTDPGKGWDGTNSGVALQPDMYVWMVEGIGDNKITIQKKGTVVLIR
jgi:gliding motility-associated-like protein